MTKKIKLRPIILWIIFICTILYLIQDQYRQSKTRRANTEIKVEKQITSVTLPSRTKSDDLQDPPAILEDPTGWKFDGEENGFKLFKPDSENPKETTWFTIKGYNCDFIVQDCVVDLRLKGSGNKVSYRFDHVAKKMYLETSPGVFATERWTKYLETIKASDAIRFRQYGDEELVVTVMRSSTTKAVEIDYN